MDIAEDLGLRKGTVSGGGIKTADGTQHKIDHFVRIPIAYNNRNETFPLLLIPSIPDCIILGWIFGKNSALNRYVML